jgi:hypothetical protein
MFYNKLKGFLASLPFILASCASGPVLASTTERRIALEATCMTQEFQLKSLTSNNVYKPLAMFEGEDYNLELWIDKSDGETLMFMKSSVHDLVCLIHRLNLKGVNSKIIPLNN